MQMNMQVPKGAAFADFSVRTWWASGKGTKSGTTWWDDVSFKLRTFPKRGAQLATLQAENANTKSGGSVAQQHFDATGNGYFDVTGSNATGKLTWNNVPGGSGARIISVRYSWEGLIQPMTIFVNNNKVASATPLATGRRGIFATHDFEVNLPAGASIRLEVKRKGSGHNTAPMIDRVDVYARSGGGSTNTSLAADTGTGTGTGSVGDLVWHDTDGDGLQDAGETGIANVAVALQACTGSSVIDSTETDGNGGFLFENVAEGRYKLVFDAPSGLAFSPRRQGDKRAKDSDAFADGTTGCFSIADGTSKRTFDAGLYKQAVEREPATAGHGLARDREQVCSSRAVCQRRGPTQVEETTDEGGGRTAWACPAPDPPSGHARVARPVTELRGRSSCCWSC
jgi:hypothetical protein